MPPYPNSFLPSKKTRDFCITDTVIAFDDTHVVKVADGNTLAPDTLVVLTALHPDTVAAALTGMPVIGTDTVFGVTACYSNNTQSAAGNVIVAKTLPGMTYRVQLDETAKAAITSQTLLEAIMGNRYFLATTTDADGFDHQVLDVTGGTQITSMIRVIDGDYTTGTVLVQIIG